MQAVSSPRARETVAVGTGATVEEALVYALRKAGLERALEPWRQKASCKLVVKPVLAPGAEIERPPLRYAEPELVESLVAWLHDRGFSEVKIAVSGPRGEAAASRVGYTSQVWDLTSDETLVHFGSLLGGQRVSQAWLDADVRIVVAKARTDRQLMFAGSLVTALGCLSAGNKLAARLVTGQELADAVGDILTKLPVAFGVIDAWHTADEAQPSSGRSTRAVLASSDLLALDWVLGEVMGLDGPELNPLVRSALDQRGVFEIDRWGDLTEWDPWRNPRPSQAALADIGAGRWWGSLAGWREVSWTDR